MVAQKCTNVTFYFAKLGIQAESCIDRYWRISRMPIWLPSCNHGIRK